MEDDDLSTSGGRLRWARKRAGYATAKAGARAVKLNEVSYRALENNQHGLSKHATKLSKAFGVSIEWLTEGGRIEEDHLPKPGELGTPDVLASYGIELVRRVDIAYAMGDGSIIADYPEVDFVPFDLQFLRQVSRSTSDKLFIAIGIGDSMEPTLRRDDLVMIDSGQNRLGLNDQVYAVAYAGTGMIKRVRRLAGGRMHLLSDNPSVPPLEADEEDVHLVGRVVWSARSM